MLRKPTKQDVGPIIKLITAAAADAHFDPVLAENRARSWLRKDLTSIMQRGRRTDEPLLAQLLAWDVDGSLAGFYLSSSVVEDRGNEIYMTGIFPEFRGRGEATRMLEAVIAAVPPELDLFSRCLPVSQQAWRIKARLGFQTLRTTDRGVRILHRPGAGRPFTGDMPPPDALDPFTVIRV